MHSPERAALLHGIRWDRNIQQQVIERLKRTPSRTLLIAIMDAVFKIEAALAAADVSSGATRTHLSSALNDLITLLEDTEPDDVILNENVIDILDDSKE